MKLAALLIVVLLTLSVSCGGQAADPGTEEFDAEDWSVMQDSAEFAVAHDRYKACMLADGYPETDQRIGVTLKDGTVVKPSAGTSYTLSGAYLEYVRAHEGCEISSGMNAVREEFGTANPTPNPAVLKRTNETHLKEFGCMKTKGWDIPEPVTSRGILIFDVQFESEEQHTAYNLDYYGCMAELGTVNGAGQRIQ